jgi:hypothetical protein
MNQTNDSLQQQILASIDNPKALETLFRNNKQAFQQAFNNIFQEVKDNPVAQSWHERLNYREEEISWGSKLELLLLLAGAFVTGLIIKIPHLAGLDQENFLSRNIGLAILPIIILYLSWKQKLPRKKMLFPVIGIVIAAIYINLVPNPAKSDSITLACLHLPLFLWSLLGFTFIGGKLNNNEAKIGFLRYNGDLVVMSAVIILAGVLFTGINFGLFQLTGIDFQPFFEHYIVIWGPASVPLFATFLVRNNPLLVNKISPVIAKIFTPLVLVTLLGFLFAVVTTSKNIYQDREFLLTFNGLLIGVMAIIIFSVTEAAKSVNNNFNLVMLIALSVLTIIANGIALSAISFRLMEFGATPNRLAVLGSNILIFLHLIAVARQLILLFRKKSNPIQLENTIGYFLPAYSIWAAFVTFILPLLFQFK